MILEWDTPPLNHRRYPMNTDGAKLLIATAIEESFAVAVASEKTDQLDVALSWAIIGGHEPHAVAYALWCRWTEECTEQRRTI